MGWRTAAGAMLAMALGWTGPALAQSAAITRHANPVNPDAIILQGVTIPPGAELLMLSGMVPAPIDPARAQDGLEAFGDTRTQTISTLNRIKDALAARGYALSDVVRLTVYLVGDPRLGGKADLAGMNAAYRSFFGTAENPNLVARTTVQIVALGAPHFLVEIDATAAKVR
ncbi:RidA family protein [Sphingomonas sp.]|uniref:RidA family protein n=1 Tax=Sphingomonas sp. TaxID=28214 RepID=UPI002D804E4C|nr:RidA family protein [Sphingomonas sp.]